MMSFWDNFLQSVRSHIHFYYFGYLFQWLVAALLVGVAVGSASAFFLVSLEWATQWREAHLWIVALLPFGGLLIGLAYHYYGQEVVKGNNQLLEEIYQPQAGIPFKMAPLVLFGTLATHFFGGSAGREGTAVQMGGAIADQLTKALGLSPHNRRIILLMGISAGFASVFGTPLAGAVFALEVLVLGRMRYESILPVFLSAFIGDYTCHAWQVAHTEYHIGLVPAMTLANFLWVLPAGICFGWAAFVFSKATHFWGDVFKAKINYPPLRPFVGGIFIALAVGLIGTSRYIGLGVPVIVSAFEQSLPWYEHLLKILFTSFTLGAGFKGGEVTPLFYVGATLGSSLSELLPLPTALLAGMGFVAVFSGATNTPIACTLMGIELFGAESAGYMALACVLAYLFSGHSGIYSAQIIGSPKHLRFGRKKGQSLGEQSS